MCLAGHGYRRILRSFDLIGATHCIAVSSKECLCNLWWELIRLASFSSGGEAVREDVKQDFYLEMVCDYWLAEELGCMIGESRNLWKVIFSISITAV